MDKRGKRQKGKSLKHMELQRRRWTSCIPNIQNKMWTTQHIVWKNPCWNNCQKILDQFLKGSRRLQHRWLKFIHIPDASTLECLSAVLYCSLHESQVRSTDSLHAYTGFDSWNHSSLSACSSLTSYHELSAGSARLTATVREDKPSWYPKLASKKPTCGGFLKYIWHQAWKEKICHQWFWFLKNNFNCLRLNFKEL